MAPSAPSPAAAIGAAWLDAELYAKGGDPRTAHSARLLGFPAPPEGLPGTAAAESADTSAAASQSPFGLEQQLAELNATARQIAANLSAIHVLLAGYPAPSASQAKEEPRP
jgi:hypothetical protein